MAILDLDLAIKRLNERDAQMKRTFGADSPIYQDYHNAIVLAVGEENLSRNGTVSRSKGALERIDPKDIERLLDKKTAGETNKAARQQAKEESKRTGQHVTAEDVIRAQEFVLKIQNEDPERFYEAVTAYWKIVGKGGPKPTYTTIADIINTLKEAEITAHAGDPEEAQNIENKLFKRIEAIKNEFNAEDYFS